LALALALLLLITLGPAPAAAIPVGQPLTQVRVVNALVGAPAVEVVVDGVPTGLPLAFGANPAYVPVPPGPHIIALAPAGAPPAPLLSTEITVAPGATYTLFAIGGEGAPPGFLALADQPLGASGAQASARFVHASPNTPPVDLAITGGPVLFSGIAFGQASPYILVAAGTLDLEARLAGTPTVVLNVPAVEVAPGGAYTFAALGLMGGAPPLGYLSMSDL
jgi:hypothetical protein